MLSHITSSKIYLFLFVVFTSFALIAPLSVGSVEAQTSTDSAFAAIGTDKCKIRVELSKGEVVSISGLPDSTITVGVSVTEPDEAIQKSGSNSGDYGTTLDEHRGELCSYSWAKQIISWITLVVGVASLIFILIAGLLYATAGDDTEKTDKSKKTILAAIVGLVIVLLSQVILRIVRGFI